MDALLQLLLQYPIVLKIVVLMGTLRLIFKPLTTAIQTYVDSTESPADNLWWESVKGSKPYQWVAFALDWIASVKLPKQQ